MGKIFEELTVANGILLRGDKIVIPPGLQGDVIALAHEAHGLGEEKTVNLLRESLVSYTFQNDKGICQQLSSLYKCCSW